VQILLLALSAYVLGQILDSLASNILPRIFPLEGSKDKAEAAFKRFKARSGDKIVANIELTDWPILYMYIKQRNENVAERVDNFNAQGIMLRNISFALLILALGLLILQIVDSSLATFVGSILSLLLAILAYKRSVRIATWFYSSIYEAIVAYSLDVSQLMYMNPPGVIGAASVVKASNEIDGRK
jgi:hypothetical protein